MSGLTATNSSALRLLALSYVYPPASVADANGLPTGGNNGNLQSQTIHNDRVGSEAAFTVTQSYTSYDGANRLTGFSENNHAQTYNYDAFGNRWVVVSDPVYPTNVLTPTQQSAYDTSNNRFNVTVNCAANSPTGYDLRGNLESQCPFSLTYDGEDRQVSATNSTAGVSVTYGYDGNGRRVQKVTGGVTTTYVYDAFGNLAAEYSTQAPTSSGTEFYTADHLGSTRLITSVSGSVLHRYDYLPFGEGLAAGVNGRSSLYSDYNGGAFPGADDGKTIKFTGKERDAETGLDYFGARYMSSAQGRFTSPDPSPAGVSITDPQSWNLYSYVQNRPTRFIDVNGKWATDIHAQIVTYALQNYVSAGELNELRARQYSMDADQSDQNTHAMANAGQSVGDASGSIGGFIYGHLAIASANVSNGRLNRIGLDALGDAMHTLEDLTSPMHTDANFAPMVWNGGYWPPSKWLPCFEHVSGEASPDQDWSRIGLAIRLTMAAHLTTGASCEKGMRCLTPQNFESEFRNNISDYVNHFYNQPELGTYPGLHGAAEDAARQCALGNPAACP